MSIRLKLMIILLLLSILPVLIVGTYYDIGAQKTIKNKVGQFAKQLVKQNGLNLNYKINELEKSINIAVRNESVLDILSKKKYANILDEVSGARQVKKHFDSIIYSNTDINSIILFLFNGDVEIYGEKVIMTFGEKDPEYSQYFKTQYDDFKKSEIYKKVMNAKGDAVWVTGFNNNYDQIFLMKKFSNFNLAKPLGVIIYAIDQKVFSNIYSKINTENEGITFITDKKNKIIMGKDKEQWQEIAYKYSKNITQEKPYDIFMTNNQLVSYCTINNGWKLVNSVYIDSLVKDMKKVRINTIIIGLICFISAVFISIGFSQKISKNINILIDKMQKVEKGDMEIIQNIETNDEIGIIDLHFDKMVKQLKSLINKTYVQQLEKHEAEINALQYQINPHFLYNTLEVINSIVAVYGCYEIREISQRLGDMFRYNMSGSKDEFTTLKNELEHIKNYIYLQQLQFDDSIEVFFDINPSTKKCKVIKFILQPIVENAIQHGYKNRIGKGYLEISTYIEDDNLFIMIQDDGVGMNEHKIEELNEYINEKTDNVLCGYKKSIGLKNVNMRIKLVYNESYGMTISSREKMGTSVLFKLPVYGIDGGDKNV